jgi:hypothetical protein
LFGACGDLALAIALVRGLECAAMACAKCAVGENLSKLPTKIKTYSLHVTAPLQKHFVASRSSIQLKVDSSTYFLIKSTETVHLLS